MHSRLVSDVALLCFWSVLSLTGAVSAREKLAQLLLIKENQLLEQLLYSEVPISVPANPDTVNLFGVPLSTSNYSVSSTARIIPLDGVMAEAGRSVSISEDVHR